MPHHYPNWLTVPQYARLCGVSKNNVIHRRIRNKKMIPMVVDGVPFIDPVAYPPRKRITGLGHAPKSGETSPRPPKVSKLVGWRKFAKKKGISEGLVLEKAIADDACVVIGNRVFIDSSFYASQPFEVEYS